jgi:hypothetical protein
MSNTIATIAKTDRYPDSIEKSLSKKISTNEPVRLCNTKIKPTPKKFTNVSVLPA